MNAIIQRPIGPATTPACLMADGKLKIPVPTLPLNI